MIFPAVVALVLILATRKAALALGGAGLVGAFIISNGNPFRALRSYFEDHLFGALSGAWHVGPILFTLILGAFAALLEKSGGFQNLLHRLSAGETEKGSLEKSQGTVLFGVYGLGLLCFFDGLANSILVGRVARPMTDALKIPRQLLAYLIDSTSSSVASVAFISTWIATQLSLIQGGLEGAPFPVQPVELFFASIPANAYCLLTLVLLPLVIHRRWYIGPMARAGIGGLGAENRGEEMPPRAPLSTVLVPLGVLILAVPGMIYLWQDGDDWSWKNAFSSSGVPQAMVAAGVLALATAWVFFPRARRSEVPGHATEGAAALLPALVILILAWALGSVFKELETAKAITAFLGDGVSIRWFPLAVFLLGAVTSFLTGSSWGTMGLLMPLALPIALGLGSELAPGELVAVIPVTISAVFGGAVFGDHCSPFSDTTIVSALASGCSATSHVATQLPYALFTAVIASGAYVLMALSVSRWLATGVGVATMVGLVFFFSRSAKR